jgi:Spy/CpxP family protein refolding chaperone
MKTILLAFLLAISTAALAQSPDAAKAPRKPRHDCSQAKDPKACEEQRARMKDMRAKASKACEGKQATERRECMRRELCAQAKDPKACEARAEKAKAERRKARQASNKPEK